MAKKLKSARSKTTKESNSRGQLRIGDHWNAITILALSQSNPLKAIAEFVENSIDAGSTCVHVFRGKKNGSVYLRIVDNGRGIPKDDTGIPDFKYVATHICNSIKRQLKARGAQGIQGEFGIGLLSFWTVGETLTLRSAAEDGHIHQMILRKGQSGYEISRKRTLLAQAGTELIVQPLLPGLRQISGDKLQWYLGIELRNRLLERGVEVHIHDLISRSEYQVEPQRYEGRKLTAGLPPGLRAEIYLDKSSPSRRVALFRQGTRVFEDIQSISELDGAIWNSGYFSGYIECPDLQLTPGSRSGVIQDEKFEALLKAIHELENALRAEIEQLKKAEEDQTSRATYATLHRAFRDAMESLPPEEYDWVDLQAQRKVNRSDERAETDKQASGSVETTADQTDGAPDSPAAPVQPAFFEFPGPLHTARVTPASSLLSVAKERKFRVVARDRKGTPVSEGLLYDWEISEGQGSLDSKDRQEATFIAPSEPGITKLRVVVRQGEIEIRAEATITVTDSLVSLREGPEGSRKGLPSFTYDRAPGQLWRSRYDSGNHLVCINSGHRDFLFASSKPQLKLRYLVRLFSKELVLSNFSGLSAMDLLDRQIEVSLRAEEFLR